MTLIQRNENWEDLPYRHAIHTRSGWIIPFPDDQVPKRNQKQMEIAVGVWQSMFGHLTPRSVSSYPYNCVGLIFSSRRAWIDITHIDRILSEDGYRQIDFQEVLSGDVVVYHNEQGEPCHVALITEVLVLNPPAIADLQVISKWGIDPEFIHPYREVPKTLGTPTRYFTDRPRRDLTYAPGRTIARK